jgi:hypothetical protein
VSRISIGLQSGWSSSSRAQTPATIGAAKDVPLYEPYAAGPDTVQPPDSVAWTAVPNPFSTSTRISISLDSPRSMTARVYDCRGSLVRTLVEDSAVQRSATLSWDGTNDRGGRAASGVYFLAISFGGSMRTIKIVLTR